MDVSLYSEFGVPILRQEKIYNFSRKEKEFIFTHPTKLNPSSLNLLSDSRYVLEHKKFKKFKKFIEETLKYYSSIVLEFKDSSHFYVTESWFNHNKPGTWHHAHWHPNSIISGVYCLEGASTPIILERSERLFPGFMFNYKKYNKYTCLDRTFHLKEGSFLLFPSSTIHYVPKNKTSKTRTTFSFNTFIKGDVGFEHSELKL